MALAVRHFISTKAYVMPAAATDVLLGISRRVTAAEHRHHPQHVQCTRFKSTTTNQSSGMATKLLDTDTPIIPLAEAKRFIRDCMEAVGTPRNHAEALGDLLVEADYRGHYSHGMNRLELYINDITGGTCDSKAVPKILKETPATAWVDGMNGLGAVIGNFCMELAMKKAKEVGVGWVCAKQSNHYGIAGKYSLMAIEKKLIGMSFTNTSPFMTPTRGIKAALGTNPLALGAPGKDGDSFVLDMATTAVAVGKIEIQRRKNAPIPEGWAQDDKGNITTNAEVAFNSAALMPVGGAEITSGYKGYGLGLMVETLCGILSGSQYGPNIRGWGTHTHDVANLGQCFIAVDPECFAPGFDGRMSDLMDTIRNMEPADPNKPILIAGDPERIHMKAVDEAGGVKYLQNQMDTCAKLSKTLNVEPMKPCT